MKTAILKCMLSGILMFGLTACTAGGFMSEDVYQVHSFSFDTRQDSPDVQVLDYQYSNGRHNGVRANIERIRMGETFNSQGISGNLLRGEFLYVKWRVKKPGSPFGSEDYLGPYEDRVDLRSRLPDDISNLEIHFVIRGTQLYVYLIYPGLKDTNEPEGPIRVFRLQKQVQIYPDQSKRGQGQNILNDRYRGADMAVGG